MLTVYLLRHGETFYNADGNRYCGATDIGLTELGTQQAYFAAEMLKSIEFDAIYASPLQRAFNTATIASGSGSVIADSRLTEANFGIWEGKTRAEFVAENPELWKQWSDDPDCTQAGGSGETAMEVVRRVDDFFTEKEQQHDGQTILVVAHNAVNRFYMAYKLGMPLKNYRRLVQDNSTVTIFSLGGAEPFSLLKLNSR
ncbi:histidine phosphatase family protein [Dyadobacter psychrophilus]|uniref:Probable phosphoglycerate mutase n=1 Tax=Dyadobacter psychrophilus TaxID=651661 RepID=A0A1T5ED29_9BACT|nr:histidine phosphatase family protein [Dyadobacter psychrophilus]SKB81997.1 probable phosphoglycerate mutase [Dyadobacter psychrophilus]